MTAFVSIEVAPYGLVCLGAKFGLARPLDGATKQNPVRGSIPDPLGAVADWMHRVVGGLAPLQPGASTAPS